MTEGQKHILIVEDDPEIASLLELHFTDRNYLVSRTESGTEGLRMALEQDIDLVILDLMLPGMEVCKGIRAANNALPVLMLTALSHIDRSQDGESLEFEAFGGQFACQQV